MKPYGVAHVGPKWVSPSARYPYFVQNSNACPPKAIEHGPREGRRGLKKRARRISKAACAGE